MFAVTPKKVPFKAFFTSMDYKGECSQPHACCLQKCKISDFQSQAQIPGGSTARPLLLNFKAEIEPPLILEGLKHILEGFAKHQQIPRALNPKHVFKGRAGWGPLQTAAACSKQVTERHAGSVSMLWTSGAPRWWQKKSQAGPLPAVPHTAKPPQRTQIRSSPLSAATPQPLPTRLLDVPLEIN